MTLRVTLRAKAPIPLDLTFAVGPGELLALVGPSGSGKTTTLRTIAGFWRPETAQVEAAGSHGSIPRRGSACRRIAAEWASYFRTMRCFRI
ncbi:MAG: hypothetical protein Tsb0024_04880 [Ruegeria sp.]